ncbi:porin [Martelella mediterranea]|uniref:Porin n=1 Tax=Martelella mediterranea TaxID=293089 RepID=A0A4R3NY58_9HYPH|nr:porin [Martelella mediterranea]TCT44870.1 porin-like protein [Martelella mediterranea]
MRSRYLLISTAAAAVMATTGAEAADMVMVEPTAPNYVEVCDAFGAGYFYIPGTETCLTITGYARFETKFGGIQTGSTVDGDWSPYTKANIAFIAKTDTELGVLTSNITPEFYYYSDGSGDSFTLDEAYIDIGGAVALRAGYVKGYWNQDLWGELDNIDNVSRFNSIRLGYYGTDHLQAALSVDAISPDDTGTSKMNKLGLSARLGYVVDDGHYLKLDAAYDTDTEAYALRPWAGFGIFGGTFEIAGLYASDEIAYAPNFTAANWNDSPIAGTYLEYAVATNYYFNLSENFVLAPQAQYNVASNDKAFWEAGFTADWEMVDDLHLRTNLNYAFIDEDWNQQNVFGWFRLERDF